MARPLAAAARDARCRSQEPTSWLRACLRWQMHCNSRQQRPCRRCRSGACGRLGRHAVPGAAAAAARPPGRGSGCHRRRPEQPAGAPLNEPSCMYLLSTCFRTCLLLLYALRELLDAPHHREGGPTAHSPAGDPPSRLPVCTGTGLAPETVDAPHHRKQGLPCTAQLVIRHHCGVPRLHRHWAGTWVRVSRL